MKLFRCNYLENNDEESYLTVGEDFDTESSIEERELKKRDDWNCLYFFGANEIKTVDGYEILVGKKVQWMAL